MDKLKQQLFLATLKSRKLYQIMLIDEQDFNDSDVNTAKIRFQTLYCFLLDIGLEPEYLEWAKSLKNE